MPEPNPFISSENIPSTTRSAKNPAISEFKPFTEEENVDFSDAIKKIKQANELGNFYEGRLVFELETAISKAHLPNHDIILTMAKNGFLDEAILLYSVRFDNQTLIDLINLDPQYGLWIVSNINKLKLSEKLSSKLANTMLDNNLGQYAILILDYFVFEKPIEFNNFINRLLVVEPDAIAKQYDRFQKMEEKLKFKIDPRDIILALLNKNRYDLILSRPEFSVLLASNFILDGMLLKGMGDQAAINFDKFNWPDKQSANLAMKKLIDNGYGPAVAINILNFSQAIEDKSDIIDLVEKLINHGQSMYIASNIEAIDQIWRNLGFGQACDNEIARIFIQRGQPEYIFAYRNHFKNLDTFVLAEIEKLKDKDIHTLRSLRGMTDTIKTAPVSPLDEHTTLVDEHTTLVAETHPQTEISPIEKIVVSGKIGVLGDRNKPPFVTSKFEPEEEKTDKAA